METTAQCGSCEIEQMIPKDGHCQNCGSGNWVWGTIDETEKEVEDLLTN